MKVKMSVKKLHRIEQMYKNRIKANRRTYRAEVLGWRTENEALKKKVAEMFNDRHNFEEKLAEADASLQRMHERIEAYQQEIEDLKHIDNDVQAIKLAHKREVEYLKNNQQEERIVNG